MIVLRKGAKGTAVLVLQHLMNIALAEDQRLKVDGEFGAKTHEAVNVVQARAKLKVDGVVGRNTWKALGLPPQQFPLLAKPLYTPWMIVAEAEMGVRELRGATRHTPRIVEYHKTTTLKASDDETPWCSSFVNWVIVQTGRKGTDNALAKSWLKWGRALKAPKQGAIAVIKRKNATSDASTGSSTGYHVAFYVKGTSSTITLLGGNQRNSVRESTYSLAKWDVVGYRWPLDAA